ncbi:hypothetical protein L0663_05190 [Dyadobacter sp. CY107]|uniref:hypothetical protein n=1 Tax=Dyadobacter fanqingshengii TaxID=2906443 RepID=UPI001F3E4BD1|nr:hypothetical protein [Dyadobacter fanqingshengii]MCF2502762.1 hypothetical protein [Dyadobacter fanqingshengii]
MKKQGRPSLYKSEYDDQTRKLCLLGCTHVELADFFGVNPDTIYEWKNVHPSFSEAARAGKIKADADVAEKLHARALGCEWTEDQAFKIKHVKYDGNGKKLEVWEEVQIVAVRKAAPPDTPAISLWLRNRQSGKWRDKPDAADDLEDVIPVKVVVNVVDATKHADA